MKTEFANRFAIAYAIIGAQAIASIALFAAIMLTPVTPVAHKKDITNSLGGTSEKALIAQAEAYLAQGAKSSGVTILSQTVKSVTHPSADKVVVTVKVNTLEVGDTTLKVTFRKGIYNVDDVQPA